MSPNCNIEKESSKYRRFLICSSILSFFPFLGSTSASWIALGSAEISRDLALLSRYVRQLAMVNFCDDIIVLLVVLSN